MEFLVSKNFNFFSVAVMNSCTLVFIFLDYQVKNSELPGIRWQVGIFGDKSWGRAESKCQSYIGATSRCLTGTGGFLKSSFPNTATILKIKCFYLRRITPFKLLRIWKCVSSE